jgi:hypothetical protein
MQGLSYVDSQVISLHNLIHLLESDKEAVHNLFRKLNINNIRGPFKKFVGWRQCAAVMQKEGNSITVAHCHQSTNFSNGCLC